MKLLPLIVKEIRHGKVNFGLSLVAVLTAAALFVFFLTTGQASKRETTRLMRDMGYNLRIIPADTDMEKFWAEGYSDLLLPEDCVFRFADREGLSYNHLLALLQKKVTWRGREIILQGITAEVMPPDKKKPPMIFSIRAGTVYAGFELARGLDLCKGDTIDLMGKRFEVAECLSESGSRDDITLYCHLEDAQALLNLEGWINEIKALECLCLDPARDSLALLRSQLETLIPEARVVQIKKIASAREKQRLMMETYFARAIPFILAVSAAWIMVLAMMNVRERRREIGILRALGYGSGGIAFLILGRAVLMGMVGGALGFGAGTALAQSMGPEIFQVTAGAIRPAWELLGWSAWAAAVFAALACLIPAMTAVTRDPASTLKME